MSQGPLVGFAREPWLWNRDRARRDQAEALTCTMSGERRGDTKHSAIDALFALAHRLRRGLPRDGNTQIDGYVVGHDRALAPVACSHLVDEALGAPVVTLCSCDAAQSRAALPATTP